MLRRSLFTTGLFTAAALGSGPALADDPSGEVLALYRGFLAAQNARDLALVRTFLLDSPKFLWISDGKPYWGPDALVERMRSFQLSDVWFVTPDFPRARVVDVAPGSAFIYLPLTLTIGPKANPSRIDFLVNVLCVQTDKGWRIGALFTTEEKA